MQAFAETPPAVGIEALAAWTRRQPELQVWVKDLRSRFLAVSHPLAQSCGTRPEDMMGRTEASFFPPARVRQFRHDDLRVVALNQTLLVEESGPAGRFATLKWPLHGERGQVCGTVGIAHAWPHDRSQPPVLQPATFLREPPAWLADMRLRIEADFRTAVRVQLLAAQVGRHPNHVSRAFRWYFGVSVVEWIHRLRVAWVAENLLSQAHRLSTVAQLAGFADQAHMTRVFKRYYGLTPAQYREALSLIR